MRAKVRAIRQGRETEQEKKAENGEGTERQKAYLKQKNRTAAYYKCTVWRVHLGVLATE